MANQMKFTGKVTVITALQSGETSKGTWVKQSVVIEEVKDQYPQSIVIECFNKAEEVNKISVGCTCDVIFNVSAKEYQGRYFGANSLWKFENIITAQTTQQTAPVAKTEDNLPF